MNDELQKALAEFVKATLAGFQAGRDFVVAEAPEVIQQLIRWKFWEAVFFAVFAACLVSAWLFLARRNWKRVLDEIQDKEPPAAIILLGASGFVALAFLPEMLITNTLTAIQIYLAPKVWLIEWAMTQVKK